jgi:hypothetical protein
MSKITNNLTLAIGLITTADTTISTTILRNSSNSQLEVTAADPLIQEIIISIMRIINNSRGDKAFEAAIIIWDTRKAMKDSTISSNLMIKARWKIMKAILIQTKRTFSTQAKKKKN